MRRKQTGLEKKKEKKKAVLFDMSAKQKIIKLDN